MNNFKKLILVFLILFSITGCSDTEGCEYATSYVKSILDSTYYNEYAVYQEFTQSSDSEIVERYETGIDYEVESFFYNWNIIYPTDQMYEDVATIYKEMYLKANYEVNEAVKISDSEFEVTIDIQPIDVFLQVIEEMNEYVDVLTEKYEVYDYTTMSDEEYEDICIAYDNEWANAVIDSYQDAISNIGYGQIVSVTVSVRVENNIYVLSNDSLMEIDAYIIQY
ncbi:hypothetical protein [Tannockella kyphosi]|uniref:hypothetical protein n=1 Tax=Tannockella kyphosi TaxID=2899121 RepID=UPI002010DECB|nr:hypothetical protein [Tannockella kyphosi]